MGDISTNPFTGSISDAGNAAYGTAPTLSLSQTVGDILSAVFGVLGVLFLVLTVYAGILWMTATGDPKQVTKAKDILIQSVTGLVICLLAYSITFFVIEALTNQ